MVKEAKELYMIAIPMIMSGLLVYGRSPITMFFLGKLGKEALAGGSLAISVANITGYSIISGLASGMEGISSQAFGAKQWSLMCQTLQRTITILIISTIPISLFWFNSQSFFIFWVGQTQTISSISTTYLSFSIPSLIFQSFINPLKIFLRTQKITSPLIFSATLSLLIHALIDYLSVYHFNLGVKAIALSGGLTDFIILIILLIYLLYFCDIWKRCYQGLTFQCLRGWKSILCQAIPSCVSICLEWWWYEVMILLSGLLRNSNEAVATMGILIQATALVYQFPIALNQAASTRVGNELGANEPKKAKTCSRVALSCGIVTGLIAMIFMILIRDIWGHVFTNDGVILSLTATALPVVGLCEIGNCPQTTACGVLRGSARPTLGASINLGSFYGVGFPVAVLMGFTMKMGLVGLWLGLLAAQVVCAVVMVLVVMITNWKEQAERARELTGTISVVEEAENDNNENVVVCCVNQSSQFLDFDIVSFQV